MFLKYGTWQDKKNLGIKGLKLALTGLPRNFENIHACVTNFVKLLCRAR